MGYSDSNLAQYFSSEEKYEVMPQIVYHYCSIKTFFSIIENSTIRLANIVKSNDAEEITYVIPYLEIALERLTSIYNQKLPCEYQISYAMIQFIIEKTFNDLSKNFYVACFSKERSLLSQWVRYADDARGVSIGFGTDQFVKLQVAPYTGYVFGGVIYDVSMVEKRLEAVFRKAVDEKWEIGNHGLNQNIIINCINNLVSAFLYYSVLYKNPFFQEEKEWRLIFNPFGRIRKVSEVHHFVDRITDTDQYHESAQGFNRESIKCQSRNNNITSYIDLNFAPIKQSLIKEVVIGPASKLDRYDKDLLLFFNSNGYKVSDIEIEGKIKVTKINAPYRPTS